MIQKNSQNANSDVKLELLERLDAIGYNKIIHQSRNLVKTYSMQNLAKNTKEYKLQEPVDIETENAELKRQLEDVRGRLKAAQTRAERAEARMRPQALEKDIQSLAGKLIKEYGSDLKKADITDDLRDLGNYILRMGDGENLFPSEITAESDMLQHIADFLTDT